MLLLVLLLVNVFFASESVGALLLGENVNFVLNAASATVVNVFSASECVGALLLGKNVNFVLLAMLLLLLWL